MHPRSPQSSLTDNQQGTGRLGRPSVGARYHGLQLALPALRDGVPAAAGRRTPAPFLSRESDDGRQAPRHPVVIPGSHEGFAGQLRNPDRHFRPGGRNCLGNLTETSHNLPCFLATSQSWILVQRLLRPYHSWPTAKKTTTKGGSSPNFPMPSKSLSENLSTSFHGRPGGGFSDRL